ncbi:saccharopine dehydrogenase NADP-binding domain-containing protein [Nitrospirillum sp. BR 11164]|nr:saccharopine dehydrogenase NADP-binding domain-containing protein [Nitrospirillum sp. BR 11164]MEA1647462.1 saccharopine dehydrogenase NADP-binding domain-containing protein [Nitrospirillum sp. BR 11164]
MSKPGLRVLIMGGYGTFGGRIATLLADEPGLTLVIAGRSAGKAAAFCAALARACGATRLSPLAFDRDGDLAAQLSAAAPDLVIDATGPFQVYGDAPYRVVQACLDLGLPYLDLADGADFVMGIQAFDGAARARGIPVLSGVSSFPVLTAAAVRHLTPGWTAVTGIAAGVAPSPYAVVGANVLRAIASYAGRPVPLMRDGAWTRGQAMTEVRRHTIAPPGVLPLRNTRFALVEVPDLRVLPPLWPALRDIWVGAGTRPESVHRVMTGLAWLVRLRLLPSLLPLAPLFHWGAGILRWGEHRGGMFVEVTGRDAQGQTATRSWHMVAEGDDGPYIPAMPAAALVRRWLAGSPPPAGARAAVTDLDLADYQPLFAPRAIRAGVRDTPGPGAPLFAQVMGGEAWDRQPAAWRALHTLPADGPAIWRGRAAVTRGRGPLARLAAWLVGFPPSGTDVPRHRHPEPHGRHGCTGGRRAVGSRLRRPPLRQPAKPGPGPRRASGGGELRPCRLRHGPGGRCRRRHPGPAPLDAVRPAAAPVAGAAQRGHRDGGIHAGRRPLPLRRPPQPPAGGTDRALPGVATLIIKASIDMTYFIYNYCQKAD